MDATVQIHQRGSITIPADIRQRYGLQEGDTFRLLDFDGIFVLTRLVPMVPELAREIEKVRQQTGLSIEELLAGLREQRERYTTEAYDTGDAG
jgi:AbrB family looped-hinge helix DNA binding protein